MILDSGEDNDKFDAGYYRLVGSLGDYVWKDADNDGLQDATEVGVKDVIIELYKNNVLFKKDTTDATGKYLFSNLDAGTYKIKVLATSIPAGCIISTMKDTPGDDSKDSDISATNGESGDYIIDPTDATKKDILTVDAGLFTPCVKPSAGPDQTLACADAASNTLTTSTTLVPSPAGGTWTQIGTTPAVATITGNAVSAISIAGTYQFVYSVTTGVQICSDTVSITVVPCSGCVKPNAGPDVTLTCPVSGIAPTAATLTAVTTGGTWAVMGGNPASATINATGSVSGMTTAGTYKFIYSVTSGGQTCTDTAAVVVPTCIVPKGSLGDYVWKDADNDGIQDAGEAPVNGMKVILWSADASGNPVAKLDSMNTVNGAYLFDSLSNGAYIVQFVFDATKQTDCDGFTKSHIGDDAKDSDASMVGLSPVVTINIAAGGDFKDNRSIDAGLTPKVICVESCVPLKVVRRK